MAFYVDSIDRGPPDRRRVCRFVLVMCALASCRDGARVAADTTRQAPPPVVAHDTVAKMIATRADTLSDTVPHAHEPELAGVPTDSFLPKWTYDSVPGWLVIEDLWADPVAATFRRNTARLEPDSVVAIFPFDSSWARGSPALADAPPSRRCCDGLSESLPGQVRPRRRRDCGGFAIVAAIQLVGTLCSLASPNGIREGCGCASNSR